MASFPQTPVFTSTSTASASVAFGSNVAGGNLIFVIGYFHNVTGASVSDNLGNTYTPIQTQTVSAPLNNSTFACWYALNIAGGACTVTASGTGGFANEVAILCAEISGLSTSAPLADKVQAFQSNSSGPFTFSLNDSLGNPWTIQYEAQGGLDLFGAVDFTNGGSDLLLYFDNLFGNSTTGPPSTTVPVAGGANLILGDSGTSNLRLWQLTATPIPYVSSMPYRAYIYVIT